MINQFYISTNQVEVFDDIELQMLSFRRLKKGWDSGFGEAISESVIQRSINLYKNLKSFHFEYEVTPQSIDGIQLTFHVKEHFLDVLVTKHKFSCRYERGIGENFEIIFEEDNMSIRNINKKLNEILSQCFSSGPSTSQNIARGKNASKIFLQTTTEAYPYFRRTVPNWNQAEFVSTLGVSIAV